MSMTERTFTAAEMEKHITRLRLWADRFASYGPNITEWGSTRFVVEQLRVIADDFAAALTAAEALRADNEMLAGGAKALREENARLVEDCNIASRSAMTAFKERDAAVDEVERLKAERDDLHAAIWEREKPHADVLSLAKAHRSDSENVDAYEASKEAAESALAAERQKVTALREWLDEQIAKREKKCGYGTWEHGVLGGAKAVRAMMIALDLTRDPPREK